MHFKVVHGRGRQTPHGNARPIARDRPPSIRCAGCPAGERLVNVNELGASRWGRIWQDGNRSQTARLHEGAGGHLINSYVDCRRWQQACSGAERQQRSVHGCAGAGHGAVWLRTLRFTLMVERAGGFVLTAGTVAEGLRLDAARGQDQGRGECCALEQHSCRQDRRQASSHSRHVNGKLPLPSRSNPSLSRAAMQSVPTA
jgi:hypothetical protein